MKLLSIPSEQYENYKIDAMFDCYKWDPQFLDQNTLAKHVLVLSREEAEELSELTETLDLETRTAEEFLLHHPSLWKVLALPRKLYPELKRMKNYDAKRHVRLTRYDFHPTKNDNSDQIVWKVSEVNSDVPGGFAESSLLPKLAMQYLKNDRYTSIDFGSIFSGALAKKIPSNGTIMFVHCTSFSDDRQVMQYIGDKMESLGYHSLYGAADHLDFKNQESYSLLSGYEGKIDGIVRFTPIEWIKDMHPKTWSGYFDTITPSCNHPISIFAQTKRFPFVWDTLEKNGIQLDTWRKLLPKTTEVHERKQLNDFIYKPAMGRVGEKISIEDACMEGEYQAILKDVKKHPKNYIAQEKFISKPLISPEGEYYHVCLGSYAVDGKHAGFYARISTKTRIDSEAQDIPVIIERKDNHERKRSI